MKDAEETNRRIDDLLRRTFNAGATGRLTTAYRSVVTDVFSLSRELGIPALEILVRLRDFYGYDTAELRRIVSSLTPSDPAERRAGATPARGPRA